MKIRLPKVLRDLSYEEMFRTINVDLLVFVGSCALISTNKHTIPSYLLDSNYQLSLDKEVLLSVNKANVLDSIRRALIDVGCFAEFSDDNLLLMKPEGLPVLDVAALDFVPNDLRSKNYLRVKKSIYKKLVEGKFTMSNWGIE